MTSSDTPKAANVRIPEPTRRLQRARVEQAAYRAARAVRERSGMVRGLVALALVVLLASVARAGLERVFVGVWWRHW